jgi:hypothetical protein
MGHLDNSQRVVEARLTSLGRKRLAEGEGLDITQFALSDDEVDYGLWQDNVPEEDAGAIIENLPTFEAFTDETQSMRYKLLSLESNSDEVPNLTTDSELTTLTINEQNQIGSNPTTVEPLTEIDRDETALDQTLGYTAILQDRTIADLKVAPNAEPEEPNATLPALYGEEEDIGSSQAVSAVGTKFQIGWNAPSISSDQTTTLTLIGNETGLSLDLTLNVIAQDD